MAYRLWIIWKPVPKASFHGLINEVIRSILYGAITTNIAIPMIPRTPMPIKNFIFTPAINKSEIMDITNITPVPKSGCNIIKKKNNKKANKGNQKAKVQDIKNINNEVAEEILNKLNEESKVENKVETKKETKKENKTEDKKENKDLDGLISMRKALNKIKEREKNILVDRFIVGKTQIEIANELNISQAQVSRLEKNAIKNVSKLIK